MEDLVAHLEIRDSVGERVDLHRAVGLGVTGLLFVE